jgi:nicotinamide mononucleotide (NMN) deamidase PncC
VIRSTPQSAGITAAVEFIGVWTSGGQSQLLYAGTVFIGIEDEIDTRQVSVLFGGGFRF